MLRSIFWHKHCESEMPILKNRRKYLALTSPSYRANPIPGRVAVAQLAVVACPEGPAGPGVDLMNQFRDKFILPTH
jgi:hypothetical protein